MLLLFMLPPLMLLSPVLLLVVVLLVVVLFVVVLLVVVTPTVLDWVLRSENPKTGGISSRSRRATSTASGRATSFFPFERCHMSKSERAAPGNGSPCSARLFFGGVSRVSTMP